MTDRQAHGKAKRRFGSAGFALRTEGPRPSFVVGVRTPEGIKELGRGAAWGIAFNKAKHQTVELSSVEHRVIAEMEEAEFKAWDALARYKFTMFGYWAGVWVHLNRISGEAKSNPFADAVQLSRSKGFGLQKVSGSNQPAEPERIEVKE